MKICFAIFLFVFLSLGAIPKEKMITYVFLGHSNMGGYCAAMDTIPHPRVWQYKKDKGFFNGTDKDLPRWLPESGSPVMPFLKRMALLYPGYNFCGIRYGFPCNKARNLLSEENHKNYITHRIEEVKDSSVIGGILLMEGFVEGQDKNSIDVLDIQIKGLIEGLRIIVGNLKLPAILGRYEMLGTKLLPETYHRFDDLMVKKIEFVSEITMYTKLTPMKFIPHEYFCDDHHYNAAGYEIWADDAAAIIQQNGFDFWYKNEN